ncbi:MAG: dihydroorotase, partial [Clostridia bacterium]|nr:dihydroorotase [Clostridia bacterium]
MKFSMRDLLVHADNLMTDDFVAGGPRVSDVNGYTLFPGFFDVHVHFREPGFSYKETILTGSQAAAHG